MADPSSLCRYAHEPADPTAMLAVAGAGRLRGFLLAAAPVAQSAEQIQRAGEQGPSWYSAQTGLFSETPHVVLQKNFWHAAFGVSTNRFLIVNGQTGAVSSYALSNEAYSEEELAEALRSAGFRNVERFASLSGNTAAGEEDLPVVVARH